MTEQVTKLMPMDVFRQYETVLLPFIAGEVRRQLDGATVDDLIDFERRELIYRADLDLASKIVKSSNAYFDSLPSDPFEIEPVEANQALPSCLMYYLAVLLNSKDDVEFELEDMMTDEHLDLFDPPIEYVILRDGLTNLDELIDIYTQACQYAINLMPTGFDDQTVLHVNRSFESLLQFVRILDQVEFLGDKNFDPWSM